MRFLVDAASKGLISLERVAEITSTAPAEIFGFKDKGHIEPGYHADLVLYDLDAESEVREEDLLGLIGWSPYAGLKSRGVPVRTLVRGNTVFADGKVIAKAGDGRLAKASQDNNTLRQT
jgi:dihydroorotase